MITPDKITNYNRTQAELEEFLMFSIMVAGKKANQTAKKLDSFLSSMNSFNFKGSPFEFIEHLDKKNLLLPTITFHKIGQYNRIQKAFEGILQFKGKLNSVKVSELESIKGIGPKTARFFVLHSRKNTKLAVLDTHILHWLRDHGVDAPVSTPNTKKYLPLERKFLWYAAVYGITPAELDLQIWNQYSKNPKPNTK
jgi:thermostable 8-oxoguanine DNA glycosylase